MTPAISLQIGSPLTDADIAMFRALGISAYVLETTGVRRVTHRQAVDQCGIRYKSDHLEGVAFPYLDPADETRARGYRVRRDNPEMEADGTPIAKYISSPDRKHVYFGFGSYPYLANTSIPVIIVEAEKSVLAIIAAEVRANRPALVLGVGGCWGWRGITGKRPSPNGTRVDEKGALPDFDLVAWSGRDTIIAFDSNAATNDKVQAARRALTAELAKRGARVRLLDLPADQDVNGPDDYIGKHGVHAFFALVDSATPATAAKAAAKAKPEKKKQGREVVFEEPEPWPIPSTAPSYSI